MRQTAMIAVDIGIDLSLRSQPIKWVDFRSVNEQECTVQTKMPHLMTRAMNALEDKKVSLEIKEGNFSDNSARISFTLRDYDRKHSDILYEANGAEEMDPEQIRRDVMVFLDKVKHSVRAGGDDDSGQMTRAAQMICQTAVFWYGNPRKEKDEQ